MGDWSTALPFNLDGSTKTDVRDVWVGSKRAAEEIGVTRSQVWRLTAKKWAPLQERSETPPVRVLLMGTKDKLDQHGAVVRKGRPEYKYWLPDVIAFARDRRMRRAARLTRLLQPYQAQMRVWREIVQQIQAGERPAGPPPLPPLLPTLPGVQGRKRR